MAENGNGGSGGEIMLFGVRVKVDPMRKSVSMNNLSEYEQPNGNNTNTSETAVVAATEDTGYASADDAVHHQSTGGRERKRGVPWTEEEHKLFLLGLQKVGKGDWRGISRNFVKTRTPTQVASHAQKYFLRRSNLNRRRRRSSLFDITTDSVSAMPMEESKTQQDNSNRQVLLQSSLPMSETTGVASNISAFPGAPLPVTVGPVFLPVQVQNPMGTLTLGKVDQVNNASAMLLHTVPVVPIPSSSAMVDLNLHQRLAAEQPQLSLGLSLSTDQSQSSFRHSAFQVRPTFGNGEGIISVG